MANLQACVKFAVDFVSPESAAFLCADFPAMLNRVDHPDKFQLFTTCFHAVEAALRTHGGRATD